jgi:hypothetical protein
VPVDGPAGALLHRVFPMVDIDEAFQTATLFLAVASRLLVGQL